MFTWTTLAGDVCLCSMGALIEWLPIRGVSNPHTRDIEETNLIVYFFTATLDPPRGFVRCMFPQSHANYNMEV